ncbi:MAG TPA: M20 family metallopeptidase [Elusimicrobiota bacterium]|nr:M20 family metallopeptidase [Elusimicrobiota bacterium]
MKTPLPRMDQDDRRWWKTAVVLRRKIHRYPELGRREFRTTALIAGTLKAARIPFRRIRPTGIVAWLEGRRGGPCVALRADMDALPLDEAVRWPGRSRRPGVMHACGHDAHTAMLLATALKLARRRDRLAGTVKFFFQPDEEASGGATLLVRQGALSSPQVDAVFGLHVNPRLPSGTVGVKAGPLMASVDRFTLTIRGEGGHGAYPHEGRDAVVIASHAVQALQTLVSRQVDPVEPVVVSVGVIEGGRRFNILAEEVKLVGTVRTLSDEWRRKIPAYMKKTVFGVVRSLGGRCRLEYEALGDSVVNDPSMAEVARSAAVKALGLRRVISLDRPSMGGEDFSEYMRRTPGCYVYLGSGADARSRKPWHHPAFFLHDESMAWGIRYLSVLAEESLRRLTANFRR